MLTLHHAADIARLGAEVDAVLQAGANIVHFDAIDNHYVPNLMFGPLVCKALRDYGLSAAINIHLMGGGIVDLRKTLPEACRRGDNNDAFLGGFRLCNARYRHSDDAGDAAATMLQDTT